MTESLNPVQRRLLAEDLVRIRRPDEQRRYASSQRQGRIDPNPHQIDAVVFALRRIPEGGCILADEVGLGKTIEAGLIISQLMAAPRNRRALDPVSRKRTPRDSIKRCTSFSRSGRR